jgi:Tfp pilus assembly protein PilW
MELAYLTLLIATFVIIAVVSVYILVKLFAGQR